MSRTPEDVETDPDGLIRLGKIASVDLEEARCTVEIDEEFESPPLRWIEPRMGKTRCWSPPSEGEQVILLCPAGEIAGAVVLRGLVCDEFEAPSSDPLDLIQFEDEAVLSYDAEAHELKFTLPDGGKLIIDAPGGIEVQAEGGVTIEAEGGVDITAPVSIEGDVTIDGDVEVTGKITASDDVVGGGISLNSHTHGGVDPGSGSSGGPQ